MSSPASVRVNRKAADRIDSGHLWIFASDLIDRGEAQPGDVVRVVDYKGRALGTAHYSSSSQISLRLLSSHVEPIDGRFLEARIRAASEYRTRIVRNSDAYRLIYSEGDLLPGLIVDRYGEWLVVQFLSQGMDALNAEIVRTLETVFQPRGMVARNDVPVRSKEELPLEKKVLLGDLPPAVQIRMNDLTWNVDLMNGQKTGIFLDQRENYLAVQKYARGRALDCFTATGGFGLHLASVCEHVEAVDSSAAMLDAARVNAGVNDLPNIEFQQADVLDYLPSLIAAHRAFDVIVVDPPAFTKTRSALEGAIRGYKEVNLRALRLLKRGGILVSCSCSHHMAEANLLEVIANAALDGGKRLRVLERRTQSQDHPILLTVPETHYLKCLIFEVL